MRVGVLAIQGDFERHITSLKSLKNPPAVCEVRTLEDLEIQHRASEGMPIWGTCMGMIMLAKQVEGREQFTLGLLDITVRRNAFGAQVHSFESPVSIKGIDEPVLGVFIRAPIVTVLGEGVEVLSVYDDKVVAVRGGAILGTSFHPELTSDTRLHQWFCA